MLNYVKYDGPGRLSCGVAVICSITQQPTSIIVPKERELYSEYPGTPFWVIEKICCEYGWRFVEISYRGLVGHLNADYTLSVVGEGRGHYLLTDRENFIDSKNKLPTILKGSGFDLMTVKQCWSVIPQ